MAFKNKELFDDFYLFFHSILTASLQGAKPYD